METDDAGGGAPGTSGSPVNEVRGSRRRSEPVTQCIKGCTVDDDDKKLTCDKCLKFFHYRCTGLPVFQIHHFLTKNYRKFRCEGCTKVPEHLKAIIPIPPPANQTKQVLELEKKVKDKQMEVDALIETNRLLQAKIKELTSSNANSLKDCEKEKEKNSKLQADAKKLEGSIKSYDEVQIAALNEQNTSTDSANCGDTLSSLTRIMGEKFEEIQSNLKSVILTEVSKNNLQLEEKINAAVQLNKSYADTVTNTMTSTSSGAPTTVTQVDFRAVMREERNSQLADETDKRMRACNFIVHGCVEANGEIPERKENDKNFIDALFVDIGIEATYKAMHRLGKIDETSNEAAKRPIKVVMQNETDKDLVMARLNQLKGKEKYKGISITEDHSIADRKIIKEWAEKATAANANEPAESLYEWKVRGSPKNGMQLKKFQKWTPSA